MKKLAGAAWWICVLGVLVMTCALMITVPKLAADAKKSPAEIPLEVVKQDMWEHGYNYEVKGKIYNPRETAARDVRITYNVWGDEKAKAGRGVITDVVRYIPPKGTVDYTATGMAPIMTAASGIVPGVLKPMIEEKSNAGQ